MFLIICPFIYSASNSEKYSLILTNDPILSYKYFLYLAIFCFFMGYKIACFILLLKMKTIPVNAIVDFITYAS